MHTNFSLHWGRKKSTFNLQLRFAVYHSNAFSTKPNTLGLSTMTKFQPENSNTHNFLLPLSHQSNFVCIVAMFLRHRRREDVNKRICSIAYVEIHKIVISLSVWWHGNVCL